ncbi:Tax1-binding protein 3 [Holothuria leucospilota]|uniref:Tax1-binding protein 3 n=1 Tax=Holothuria leucospilota TaxID=206669 RepID=A0A9Q1C8M3_HOLLE|nr:Tax1-binding protein 3 [Holothuria leucospilota]
MASVGLTGGESIPCIDIEVHRSPSGGLGFSIAGGIDQDSSKNPFLRNDKGIFVSKIVQQGPAELAGLKIGDKLLSVNGYDLLLVTHDHAVKLLRKQKDQILRLKVTRQGMAW